MEYESVKGSYALDKEFYVKNTKYGTSTTESFTITKLGDKGSFGGFGMRSDIINVKDAWSSKNIILQNTNIYSNAGKLLPTTSGGWTPSTYVSKSTGYQASYYKDTLRIDTTGLKTTAGGARTAQLEGGYVFSQSGSNVKLSRIYTETQFSGANYYKDVGIVKTTLGFNKDAVSLIKLNKISSSTGTGSGGNILISSGGSTSSGSLSNVNQMFSASQIPKIATTSSITNIAKVSGGVSVAGVGGVSLLSNVRASTIQLPKVDTTTSFKRITTIKGNSYFWKWLSKYPSF